MNATHAIHALQFDLAIDGSSETLSRDNSQYTEWVREHLLPIIAEVIEQEAAQAGLGPHHHQRISKLELDLGDVEADAADHEVGRRLRAQLHAALAEQLAQHNARSKLNGATEFEDADATQIGAGQSSSSKQALQAAALQEFLRTGRLDWAYAKNPRYAHKRLLQDSLIQHHNAALLEEILSEPRQLVRLIRQFDTADLMQIVDQRFATWSHTERNQLLDWLSLELSQHSLNPSYCENLWLFILHGAWQAEPQKLFAKNTALEDSMLLAQLFYQSQDSSLATQVQIYREQLQAAATVGSDAEQNMQRVLEDMEASVHKDQTAQTLLDEATNQLHVAPANAVGKYASPALEDLLHLLATADYAKLEGYWSQLLRDAPQHLQRMHTEHWQLWLNALPLHAKRDLVDLFQAECAWLLDALQTLPDDAIRKNIYASSIAFALAQTPQSLRADALMQMLETNFYHELSDATPQAKQLEKLLALPAAQSYQQILDGLRSATHGATAPVDLHQLGKYWSESQWQKLLTQFDTTQLRSLVQASYESRGAQTNFVLALIDSSSAAMSTSGAVSSLQTLWRLIRAAMNIRYTLGSQNLSDEVALVLLQLNAREAGPDSRSSSNEALLLTHVFTALRKKQVLSSNASNPRQSPLAAALRAWMKSEGKSAWQTALEALLQAKFEESQETESEPLPTVAEEPRLGTAWLLEEHNAQPTWLEHFLKHPQAAIQAYKKWDLPRRQDALTGLKPEVQDHLVMALHAPHQSLIQEFIKQLGTLKDLLNKAYGSTFIGHWHQGQLTQELRLGLLGLDPKLTSSKRFEQSLSLLAEGSDQRRQARAAIVDLFTEYLARHSDRSANDWRLALEQLVLTQGEASLPQQESEMQSRASSSTLPMPPSSLQNEARQSLPLLTRELELARDVSALHARHAASLTQQSEIGTRLVLQKLWQTLLASGTSDQSSLLQTFSIEMQDGLQHLYRLALHGKSNIGQELQKLLERIIAEPEKHAELNLAIEALLWRAQQELGEADAKSSGINGITANDQAALWQTMELQDFAALRNLVDSIRFDDTSLTRVDQQLKAANSAVELKAARELTQLLGLDPNVPRERILTALIQASGQHTGLAPVKHYQNLLNRWFQTLGQADAALPFLRCVEFYASQLSPAAAQSYFFKAVLRDLLAQREIDIEVLLEQARQHCPEVETNHGEQTKPLFSGSDTQDLDTTFAYDVDHEFSALNTVGAYCLPAALSQLQSIIATPASAELQSSLDLNTYTWIRRPALRAWLSHFLGEAVLHNLVPSSSDSPLSSQANKQAFQRWRPQVRRSLEQAQDHHLLFLLAAAMKLGSTSTHGQTGHLASHLRQILSEEFSIPEAELESLSKLGHGLTPTAWRQFLGFTSDAPSDAAVSAAQTEDVRLQELGQQLFLASASNLTEESDAARLRPKNSDASPLPRSWRDHLPQILAEAMLSGHLAKLDTVWPTLIDYHRAELVRAQHQYLRQAAQRNALLKKNPVEKIQALLAINAPRLAQLFDALWRQTEALHKLWGLGLSLVEWRSHLLHAAYHASFQQDLVKQTSVKQLQHLLRASSIWPRNSEIEYRLLAQAYYAALDGQRDKQDALVQALSAYLAHEDRRRALSPSLKSRVNQTESATGNLSEISSTSHTDFSKSEQDGKVLSSQSLLALKELHQDLIAHLDNEVEAAALLQEFADATNIALVTKDLQQDDVVELKEKLIEDISAQLWSSHLVFQQASLWKRLAQELRAQTRNLTPDALHRASFGFKQIDHALAKLIDIELLDQLSEAQHQHRDAEQSPTARAPSSFDQTAPTLLVVLLQSLSPYTQNEAQWARSTIRRLLTRSSTTTEVDKDLSQLLAHALGSDFVIQRWCDLLDTVELEQFFKNHHAEIARQLRAFLPAASLYRPDLLDASGRFWNKETWKLFYQLGFVQQSENFDDYIVALGLFGQGNEGSRTIASDTPADARLEQTSTASRRVAEQLAQLKAELKQQEALRLEQERLQQEQRKRAAQELKKRARLLGEEEEIPYGESNVHNAGMVIIAPYIQRLFSILELTKNNAFVDEDAAQRAVHLLQYVVTGETSTPEYQLSLNKLLCGIHGGLPIVAGIDLSEHEKTVVEQMLNGVISHWSALGKTSIAGLRQTFLVREGQLSYDEESWHLRIPSSTFDMLLDRLPWSFSMIRLPWMRAPLHVKWRANT